MLISDIKFFKPTTVNDTSSNGGSISTVQYVNGAIADLFQNVLQAEVLTGSTKYRKIFIKNTHSSETLLNPMVWLDKVTPADDFVTLFVGTASDTQANITGSEKKYGSALLSTATTIGSSTIVVTVEDASLTSMFSNGDSIRISNMTDSSVPLSGTEEFHVISGVPVVAGTQVTITIAGTLGTVFATSNTQVMSICTLPDILPNTSSAIWARRVVPIGASPYNNNTTEIVISGEV